MRNIEVFGLFVVLSATAGCGEIDPTGLGDVQPASVDAHVVIAPQDAGTDHTMEHDASLPDASSSADATTTPPCVPDECGTCAADGTRVPTPNTYGIACGAPAACSGSTLTEGFCAAGTCMRITVDCTATIYCPATGAVIECNHGTGSCSSSQCACSGKPACG